METLEEASPEYEINSRINFNEYMISYSNMRVEHIDTSHNTDVPEEPIPENTDGIPATDIRLVSTQTGMNVQQCLDALRRNNGDIVNSIMELVEDT
jgi:NACalpha-BTF3-like transcription factor